MPIKKFTRTGPSPAAHALLNRLVKEWRQPDPNATQPIIIEESGGQGQPTHLYVVWDDWAPVGSIDLADVERALNRLAAGRPPIVVLDLTTLRFTSSLGMGLLNSFRRGLVAHGGITRIAAPQPDVLKALTLCKLTDLFEIHPTLDSATSNPALA